MKKLVLVPFFLFSLAMHSQEASSDTASSSARRYFLFEAGGSYTTMRDRVMSPMIYIGPGLSAHLGYLKKKAGRLQEFQLGYQLSFMKMKARKKLDRATLNNHRLNLSYQYLFPLTSIADDKVDIQLGGRWETLSDVRNHSSLYVYGEFVSSLCISGNASYEFMHNEKSNVLSMNLSVPLLNFMITPNYAYSPPEGFITQNAEYYDRFEHFIQSGKINTVGSYFRINNRLMLEHYFNGINGLRLAYEFDYFVYHEPAKVKKGYNQITFGTMFRF